MNTRPAIFVLFAVGSILIASTARSILATSKGTPQNAKIVFEDPIPLSPPASEPIFPGLPEQ